MKDKINQFREDHGDHIKSGVVFFTTGAFLGACWGIAAAKPQVARVVTNELGEKLIAVTDRGKMTTLLEYTEK